MTTQIAQFMRALDAMWEEHLDALLVRRDVDAALANMVPEPSVLHIPAMTGAAGRANLKRFYATEFLPYLPDDLRRARVSRTIDRFRIVDETMVSFTHDRELPWLLPGVEPTHRQAEILTIAVVGFQRGSIRSQRTLWDQASLTVQLGVPNLIPTRSPATVTAAGAPATGTG